MAHKFSPLLLHDSLYQAQHQPGPKMFGRERELRHLARIFTRRNHNNLIVVGRRGVGKTALISGFAEASLRGAFPGLPPLPQLQLDTAKLTSRLLHAPDSQALLAYVQQALAALPPCIFTIDDAESLLFNLQTPELFGEMVRSFTSSQHHLWLLIEEESWQTLREQYQRYLKSCDMLVLNELSEDTCRQIVAAQAKTIAARHRVTLGPNVAEAATVAALRLSSERAMPDRALRLLDEVCAASVVAQERVVTSEHIRNLTAERLGLPQQTAAGQTQLRALHDTLTQGVIGQPAAVAAVANILQRSLLGLKNPQRPHGSFLFLGPSGVGKTELARVLAREVFGGERALVRIDMSEYGAAHSVQRLIGAPPGYVGYEAGGQLTNPIRERPHSLILLDEIEKADPAVFDVFLQILEDGRLTDGQGATVDFTQTIIIATSNLGVTDIIAAWQRRVAVSQADWWHQHLMPRLTQAFRLEFINRFEGVVVFEPLSPEALLEIARLEIHKVEARLASHNLKIQASDEMLRQHIARLADPRFGARPLKRFIEETAESLVAKHLLRAAV
jgi:ATP-dependent Clp protease ATP-binding subunit ClpA